MFLQILRVEQKKKAKCRWCEQAIEVGTPIIKIFFWNKGDDSKRTWNGHIYFHFPNCYSAQGMDYLNHNPYVPHSRGRRAKLAPDDGRKRFLLVRKFNELVQRRRGNKLKYPDNAMMDAVLAIRMLDVAKEMIPLGGVPKNWLEKIGG